jgi:hypothetical protein
MIMHTDLSGEEPSQRALVEGIELKGQVPGAKFALKARLSPDSALTRLVATVMLTFCGCACTITVYLGGLPHWAAVAAFALPTVLYAGMCRLRTRMLHTIDSRAISRELNPAC